MRRVKLADGPGDNFRLSIADYDRLNEVIFTFSLYLSVHYHCPFMRVTFIFRF
jgi:hypothetical protein